VADSQQQQQQWQRTRFVAQPVKQKQSKSLSGKKYNKKKRK